MAYKVFGNPITKETLMGMPEYANKPIARTDMVLVALTVKKTVEDQASEYMKNLQKKGDVVGVCTIGIIYNATGDTLTYCTKHDFSGKLQSKYLPNIENGQCCLFVHEETSGKESGSCGAVVYWGTNTKEEAWDCMISWLNSRNDDKKLVFTEMAEYGHYNPNSNDAVWDHIKDELDQSCTTSNYKWNGCNSDMSSITTKCSNCLMLVEATIKAA